MTQDTRFFVVLLEVDDFYQSIRKLSNFKEQMKDEGRVTVIDVEQSSFDFIYNSLIEKANKERKREHP
jgi:hypothetical protein